MGPKTGKKVQFSEKTDVKNLTIDYEDEPKVQPNVQPKAPKEIPPKVPKEVPPDSPEAKLDMEYDRHFIMWLKQINHSFIISSYKRSTIFSLGLIYNKEYDMDKISLWLNTIPRVTGLCLK